MGSLLAAKFMLEQSFSYFCRRSPSSHICLIFTMRKPATPPWQPYFRQIQLVLAIFVGHPVTRSCQIVLTSEQRFQRRSLLFFSTISNPPGSHVFGWINFLAIFVEGHRLYH